MTLELCAWRGCHVRDENCHNTLLVKVIVRQQGAYRAEDDLFLKGKQAPRENSAGIIMKDVE